MRVMLEGWGCDVIVAANITEAQKLVSKSGKKPDGLLIDYHLDEMLGTDAAVKLRWKFGKDIPASLITADRTAEVREEARSKDMGLLNKPVKPAQLRALLNTWHSAAKRRKAQ
jgi:CheY-like chemotaxis protein